MDLDLSPEHVLLRDTIREFMETEVAPIVEEHERERRFPTDTVRRIGELGWLGIPIPEDEGGAGLDTLAYAIAIEEIGRVWGSLGLIVAAHTSLGCGPIHLAGTDEQKQRFLVPMASGNVLGAYGLTEPGAGSDAAAIATEARRVDGGYVLTGHKTYIGNAPVADLCVVFATVAAGSRARGITAFVVERGDRGFVIGDRLYKMGSRCFPAGELHFEECYVPEDRRLGGEGDGFRGLMRVFDRARVQLAASSLGVGRAALEHAVEHAREREAFGAKIHTFQAVSFRLVDAKLKLDQARLVTERAADLADAGRPFSTEAAMAKLVASEAAWFAAWAAVQTLGGAGYVRTSLVQKWLRDAKLDEIWDGTSDIMRLIVARSLFAD